jgi:hypothetical protein
MIKRPKLRIHEVGEGAEIQTKGIGNLLNGITAESFPNLCNDVDTHVPEAFLTPKTDMIRKDQPHNTS